MRYWSREHDGVTTVVTDRDGGVSAGPYAGLNLGGHVGDDPAAVERNRDLLARDLGISRGRLVLMDQCHGVEVAVVTGRPETPPAVDALVTVEPDLALVALVADCTPVLLADAGAGVLGAVHAGRPGMLAGVVTAALTAMRDLGARRIAAVVGPSVCPRCYEVPAEMRASAAAVRPESAAVSWTGTPAIDVAAGVVGQLADADVDITWLPGCAREDHSLYSHRRDGTTGRFAGVVLRRTTLRDNGFDPEEGSR